MKNRWIFYHADCLDGFGAAYAAWHKFGYADAVYRACRYDEGEDPFDMCEPGDEVFVLDFSFKREILLRQAARLKVTVIDHHESARADLEGLDFCHFNMNKSGAVLAWEFFHPNTPVPKLLRNIQDRDLWQFKMMETKEITTALRSLSMDFELWKTYLRDTAELSELGCVQLAVVDAQVQTILKRSGWLQIKGQRVPAVQCPIHQSELGHGLLTNHPDAPFAVVYFDFQAEGRAEWNRTYSLRAESGYDVQALAKSFGGGGHRNAAGFTLQLEAGSYGHPDVVSVS